MVESISFEHFKFVLWTSRQKKDMEILCGILQNQQDFLKPFEFILSNEDMIPFHKRGKISHSHNRVNIIRKTFGFCYTLLLVVENNVFHYRMDAY